MTGPRMDYETGALRDGAVADRKSADQADAAEQALRAGAIGASAFGDVGNAAAFAAQAVVTKNAQADGAADAATHREDQGTRSNSTATQGDQLTTSTTGIAQSTPPPPPQA